MNNQNYIGSSIFVIDLGKLIFKINNIIITLLDSHGRVMKGEINELGSLSKIVKLEMGESILNTNTHNQPSHRNSSMHAPIKRKISLNNFNTVLPPIK